MKDFQFSDMTPELREYIDLNGGWNDPALRDRFKELEAILPKNLINAFYEAEKIWICRDENYSISCGSGIHFSESGKYRLDITNHKHPRFTDQSKGKVYSIKEDGTTELIAEVCRNYFEFPFLFVENHPEGDFLICGEDYQAQTLINLATGERINTSVDENGFGFCWAEYKYIIDQQVLLVEGCYWAAPYEFRFYDFSDPMSGWPEIEMPDMIMVCDKPNIVNDENGWYIEASTYDNTIDDTDAKQSVKRFKKNGNAFVTF